MSARSKNKNARQDYEDVPSAEEGTGRPTGTGFATHACSWVSWRFLPIRTKRVIEGRSEGATP